VPFTPESGDFVRNSMNHEVRVVSDRKSVFYHMQLFIVCLQDVSENVKLADIPED
jgi:hypothetical protein